MKKQKGSSVIEVLLICSIIILLVAILFVNFTAFNLNAKKNVALSELGTALRAVESCNLEGRVLYCGGRDNVIASGQNCAGVSGASSFASVPVSGSAICGTREGVNLYSDAVWPNLAKIGYTYAGFAGSQTQSSLYAFLAFSDQDRDGTPDGEKGICCKNGRCESIIINLAEPGKRCYNLSGITNED